MEVTKQAVVSILQECKTIEDSAVLCEKNGWNHEKFVGVLKSLEAEGQVTSESKKQTGWKLTAEGEECLKSGSPEARVFLLLKSNGPTASEKLDSSLGAAAKLGISQAMKCKWISIQKDTKLVTPEVDTITDTVQEDLGKLTSLGKEQLEALKKRKLIAATSLTVFCVKGTEKLGNVGESAANLTAEMIVKGTWSSINFKPVNLKGVSGALCGGGHLHPLLKVRAEIRNVMLLMGFEEMPTNQWVESSFWNFDALYQPQQHPARDAHDTFFLKTPALAQNLPTDYLERVKEMHEKGGSGSIGWRYDWSEGEARKNILRTHTTAVSSRTLYKMAEEYQKTGVFTPKKWFSIDRVFRNETLDATHLAEFHQVEGFVADRGIGLGHLIGTFKEFFRRIGIKDLKFKPAYNPYTEPSMEIFGYHPILKKWVEIGNSGVFRPEMINPMGFPEGTAVVAWGIGLERTTCMQYGIANIRDLFGFQQDIIASRTTPVCWFKSAHSEN